MELDAVTALVVALGALATALVRVIATYRGVEPPVQEDPCVSPPTS